MVADPDPTVEDPDPVVDPDPTPRTFTQDELNKIVGQEKAKAGRATEARLAEQLGVTVEEAVAVIAAKSKADSDAMSEAERLHAEAVKAKAEAEKLQAEAEVKARETDIRAALAEAGVPKATLDRAVRLVDWDGTDSTALEAEIAELAETIPAMFASADPPPAGRAPSPGSKTPPPRQGTKSAYQRGLERAATGT